MKPVSSISFADTSDTKNNKAEYKSATEADPLLLRVWWFQLCGLTAYAITLCLSI
jgi:hypothetical protein